MSIDSGRSVPDGLGGPKGLEPSGLHASHAIPSAESGGFFYVEWVGRSCPWCGEGGVSGKTAEGHFFAGCADPDCLGYMAAFDFVTADHARAAWDDRYETLGESAEQPRLSTKLDMCAHGADRGSYCGYCGGYSKGAGA